jgi:hypothetical protein
MPHSPGTTTQSYTGTTYDASQFSLDIEEAQIQNRAMLRLVYVLEKGLESKMAPRYY